jgi:hypothetical protein
MGHSSDGIARNPWPIPKIISTPRSLRAEDGQGKIESGTVVPPAGKTMLLKAESRLPAREGALVEPEIRYVFEQ